jgi:photosystem II stability/assembly factor-like uncharacterized protein
MRFRVLTLALLAAGSLALAANAPTESSGLRAAPHLQDASKAPVIAAAVAGTRVVAVGDYGIVVWSDDGRTFQQAGVAPTRTVLTSVCFVDARLGWAVGHDGTVIHTTDGGQTWQLQHEEAGKDRVLLSVWFENARHGVAVGQFGLVLETDDGGQTWRERKLVDAEEQADKHLMHVFAGPGDTVLVAAEAGAIYRSPDHGRTWALIQTSNKGSFWTGTTLRNGHVLVAGLRGHVFRSVDAGLSWTEVPSGTQQSLTAMAERADGQVQIVGLSGVVLTSRDHGQSFSLATRADRASITSLGATPKATALFSAGGLLSAP